MSADSQPAGPDPIFIEPDSIAGRLLPAFLDRRIRDLAVIDQELARGGFKAIERLGHNLKGIGRSYGFDALSEIGAALDAAAQRRDRDEIRKQALLMADYLRRVRIVTG